MLVIRDVSNKIILESITSPSVSGRAITSQAWAAEGERTPCTETRNRRARGAKWEIYWGTRLRRLISYLLFSKTSGCLTLSAFLSSPLAFLLLFFFSFALPAVLGLVRPG